MIDEKTSRPPGDTETADGASIEENKNASDQKADGAEAISDNATDEAKPSIDLSAATQAASQAAEKLSQDITQQANQLSQQAHDLIERLKTIPPLIKEFVTHPLQPFMPIIEEIKRHFWATYDVILWIITGLLKAPQTPLTVVLLIICCVSIFIHPPITRTNYLDLSVPSKPQEKIDVASTEAGKRLYIYESDTIGRQLSQSHRLVELPSEIPKGFASVSLILPSHITMEELTSLISRTPTETGFVLHVHMPQLEAAIKILKREKRYVILRLPLETQDFPETDLGPGTLLTSLDHAVNLKRLDVFLKRAPGVDYIQLPPYSKFVDFPGKLAAILHLLHKKKYHLITPMNSPGQPLTKLCIEVGIPTTFVDISVEGLHSKEELEETFEDLKRYLKQNSAFIEIEYNESALQAYISLIQEFPKKDIQLISSRAFLKKRLGDGAKENKVEPPTE